MAQKEYVKITPEGLNLLTVLHYSSIAEMNSFYNKEVFFSQAFEGDLQYLFQALGNLGAYARSNDLDKDIHYVIISNFIMKNTGLALHNDFCVDIENRLNQNSSPYRKMKYITENHLVLYLENRAKSTNDEMLFELIGKYKESKRLPKQQKLF
jgi:hypothetical protein